MVARAVQRRLELALQASGPALYRHTAHLVDDSGRHVVSVPVPNREPVARGAGHRLCPGRRDLRGRSLVVSLRPAVLLAGISRPLLHGRACGTATYGRCFLASTHTL